MENKSLKSAREKRRRAAAKLDLHLFLVDALKFKKYQAKKKGIPFDLDEEWIRQQPKMCAVSGISFQIPPKGAGPLTPSFDQIEPGQGYTKNNTQLICLWLNQAYGQWSKAEIHGYMQTASEVVHGNQPVSRKR